MPSGTFTRCPGYRVGFPTQRFTGLQLSGIDFSKLRGPIAVIFDVEGTLVDCAPQTIESWRETLSDFGFVFSHEALQAVSGMDGRDLIKTMLGEQSRDDLDKTILEEQGRRYREKFLETVSACPGVRELFEEARRDGWRLALATSCQPD